IHELKLLERELKLPHADYLNTVLALPNAMGSEKQEITEKEWKEIEQLIRKAVKAFQSFRLAEGKSLEKDLLMRIKNINRYLAEIEKFEPQRLTSIKTRLSKMISEIDDASIDKNRFEQELIYYLEKIDITEEKVRLKSHCDYFLNTMNEKEANGKKLGFIIQEIGREINTIGSKANDASIQRSVVEMKDELEKMKEQVANVL
ncbi:MAG: YicC family protein, partial [Bacteroidia bacterium]